MKRRTSSAAVIALTFVTVWMVSVTANKAQPAASSGSRHGTKVGVVDLERVFDQYEQTQVLNRKMDAYTKEILKEGDERQQAIQAEQVALEAFAKDSADYFKRSQELRKKMMIEAAK